MKGISQNPFANMQKNIKKLQIIDAVIFMLCIHHMQRILFAYFQKFLSNFKLCHVIPKDFFSFKHLFLILSFAKIKLK